MKVTVTIKQTQTATIDIGAIPVNAVRDILVKNDGTFDGNWSIDDVPGSGVKWTVDSVEVEPESKGTRA